MRLTRIIKRLLTFGGCVALPLAAVWLLSGKSFGQPPVAPWPAVPSASTPLAMPASPVAPVYEPVAAGPGMPAAAPYHHGGGPGCPTHCKDISLPYTLSAGRRHSAGPTNPYAQGPLHWSPFTANPPFAQGEYVERDRVVHTPSYRLRPDDFLELVYRVTRNETPGPYLIGVGDKLRVESRGDPAVNRDVLTVLPDGTITLPMLGQVQAANRTIGELRDGLEKLYGDQGVRFPQITVTPLEVNTKLEDLRQTVQSRFGGAGQTREARVTPEGPIQMPVVGSVYVQGLTLDEAAREINARYAEQIEGIEVIPVLLQRAPRFVYVVGEVRVPGRYSLEAPTTAMQAISMAGGWNVGANLYNVIVFRRDDHWQLMATRLCLWNPMYGNTPNACDDIFLGDSDVVVVPKMKVLVLDEYIELIFTRGIYGVVPFQGVTINMAKLSSL
jgi:polysaccharide export outer membrane protein